MSALELFKILKRVHEQCLTEADPVADHPGATAIKIPLYPHQLTLLSAMNRFEQEGVKGIDCSGRQTLYTSYGILGDSVGAGKSLVVLSHIAGLRQNNTLDSKPILDMKSSNTMFSVRHENVMDCSEANAIIIVPHTLFRQWSAYIKDQTGLNAICIDKRKIFQSETIFQDIMRSDLVLISNTFYKEFSILIRDRGITWRRAYIDEADTISLTNYYPFPKAKIKPKLLF